MRKVFSSTEISETVLVRDAIEQHGIGAIIQNEHSGRTAIPGFRPPAEVWVIRDDDYESARKVVIDTIAMLDSKVESKPWVCPACKESNPQSFEMCWNCGQDHITP